MFFTSTTVQLLVHGFRIIGFQSWAARSMRLGCAYKALTLALQGTHWHSHGGIGLSGWDCRRARETCYDQ